jgi:hypothetical protein
VATISQPKILNVERQFLEDGGWQWQGNMDPRSECDVLWVDELVGNGEVFLAKALDIKGKDLPDLFSVWTRKKPVQTVVVNFAIKTSPSWSWRDLNIFKKIYNYISEGAYVV